jgi:hypothetical protein
MLPVPVISLTQASDWNPIGGSRASPGAHSRCSLAVADALIIGGWILVAALLAGVARVLSRT